MAVFISQTVEDSLLQHYKLTEDVCSQQVSAVHLQEISQSHCKDWRKLPAHLDLPEILKKDIDRKQVEENDKREEFFLGWQERKGSAATYKSLISALLKIDCRQDAESVCKLLKASSVTPSPCPPSDQVPKFPYLKDENLTEEEKERLIIRLEKESDEMKDRFSILVDKTRESLEKQKILPKDMIHLINYSAKDTLIKIFEQNADIHNLFLSLKKYLSFFDYELLALLIERHSPELKSNLNEYVAHFEYFCKRRIVELPAGFLEAKRRPDNSVHIKWDGNFDDLTLKEAKSLEYRLSKLLKAEVYLLSIQEGCVELVFEPLCDVHKAFPLNSKQLKQLREMGVTEVKLGEHRLSVTADQDVATSTERFPYLNVSSLSEQEKKRLITRLENESTEMIHRFATLVDSTRKSLEKQNILPKDMTYLLIHSERNILTKLFQENKDIHSLFLQLNKYWSFFNYELLAHIIEGYSPELKPNLREYVDNFKNFCKRRIVELPATFLGTKKRHNIVHIKIDQNFGHLTLEETKKLQLNLSELLHMDIYLLSIQEGCVELVLEALCDVLEVFPLNSEQLERLRKMGVIAVRFGEYYIRVTDLSTEAVANTEPEHGGQSPKYNISSSDLEHPVVDPPTPLSCDQRDTSSDKVPNTAQGPVEEEKGEGARKQKRGKKESGATGRNILDRELTLEYVLPEYHLMERNSGDATGSLEVIVHDNVNSYHLGSGYECCREQDGLVVMEKTLCLAMD